MKTFIVKPLITEKTMGLAQTGWFTFRTDVFTDKHRIKSEIEKIYSVNPVAIRTIIMHGKVTRVGRKGKTSAKSDWKKAFIKLKQGQTIDAFQIGGTEEKK